MQKTQAETTSEVQDNTSCAPAWRARATWNYSDRDGWILVPSEQKHLDLPVKFYEDKS